MLGKNNLATATEIKNKYTFEADLLPFYRIYTTEIKAILLKVTCTWILFIIAHGCILWWKVK